MVWKILDQGARGNVENEHEVDRAVRSVQASTRSGHNLQKAKVRKHNAVKFKWQGVKYGSVDPNLARFWSIVIFGCFKKITYFDVLFD